MKRKQFIKTSLLGGLSLSVLPQLAFNPFQEIYTREELIGKDNSDMIGLKFKMKTKAYSSFVTMQSHAYKAKVAIRVVSGYRSFEKQKQIFENKYSLYLSEGMSPEEAINKIIEYSTIPGTSRHHWGTDVDVFDSSVPQPESILEEEHYYNDGCYTKLKKWMDENANRFGFYEVYTNNPDRKGFKHEPWHYSYAPLAKPMLQEYRNLDLKSIFEEENILGNEHFSEKFINRYRDENILDINPELI